MNNLFAAACAEHVRVESRLAAVSVTPVYNIGGYVLQPIARHREATNEYCSAARYAQYSPKLNRFPLHTAQLNTNTNTTAANGRTTSGNAKPTVVQPKQISVGRQTDYCWSTARRSQCYSIA